MSVAALAMIACTPLPALAHPAHGDADAVRYAWVRGCGVQAKPCGDWILFRRDGSRTRLRDARVKPLSDKGKTLNDDLAPLSVSDDGRRVAYFRKGDGRLVVRELGGGVHVIADEVPARGYGMGDVRTMLSQDGTRLAVDYVGEYDRGGKPKRPTDIYDVATGTKLGSIPWDVTLSGFSPATATRSWPPGRASGPASTS
jgi:hypothetical protein